jgi:hypothetical protein
MPHSIFFTTKGHAIHGTDHRRNIGRPASHGCVRLERENARVLFDLVKREGMANTRVVLTGTLPNSNSPAMVRRAPGYESETTGSAYPRRVERTYRDDRPLYWQQQAPRPPFFDDDMPYRRVPPPRYIDPRYGLY